MFSFFKKKPKFNPETDPVMRFARLWSVFDVIQRCHLQDVTENGITRKETSLEYYADEAPYEALGHPHIPTASYKDMRVLMFTDFLVFEGKVGQPDSCFFEFICNERNPAITGPIMKNLMEEASKSESAVVMFMVLVLEMHMEDVKQRFGDVDF